jgi:cell division GTPase FtsZ
MLILAEALRKHKNSLFFIANEAFLKIEEQKKHTIEKFNHLWHQVFLQF